MHAITRLSLFAALAVPVLYFGAQAAAAPFFPGFRFTEHTASILGSDLSLRPEILNSGAVLTGLASFVSAWGVFVGLRSAGVWTWNAAALALCAVSFGAASVWAGIHPLPDPQHNPGALGIGMFAAPFLAFVASLALPNSKALRIYLGLNVVGFGIVSCLYAGVIPVDLQRYAGAVQRLGTLVMLLPMAILAAVLLRKPPSRR
ncbi:MAG: DUF998 domain-containing protein [Silanimonas sp.]